MILKTQIYLSSALEHLQDLDGLRTWWALGKLISESVGGRRMSGLRQKAGASYRADTCKTTEREVNSFINDLNI